MANTVNKRLAKIILILSQCIYVLFLIVWLFFAMMTLMMFDAPGSEGNTGLVLLYVLIWLYPLGLLTGLIGSWIAYRKKKIRKALLLNAIPLIWLLPIVGVIIYANTR